jgi:hypothetical protein
VTDYSFQHTPSRTWRDNVKGVTVSVSATSCSGMIKMSTAGPTNTTSGKFYLMEDGDGWYGG